MNAEQLKASILQLASEGKLVPQQAEEGVVEQIGVALEEVPFEIPESWKWVQLKSIGQIIGGGTPKTSVADYWNGDISWITPADLGKNTSKWILKGAKSITQKGLDESSAKLMPEGSVVYSSRAPIGHIAIAAHELCTNQGCKSFVPDAQFITTEWAYYMLIARTKDIQSRASGTTFKEISGKGIGETWVSLPPIAEQQRIVAKIEELLPLVESYGKSYDRLQELNAELPNKLKASILQEAIQGKLVPQLDSEEEVQQIGDAPENVPFAIPEKWKWVHLTHLCDYIQRGKSPKYSDIPKIPVIAQKCNQWDGFQIEKAKFIDPDSLKTYKEERLLQDQDVLWNSTGLGTLGRLAMYETCLNPYGIAVADSHVTVIRTKKGLLNPKFLYFYLCSPTVQNVIESRSDGSTKQKELATSTVKGYEFPLPPLLEQNRIVAKAEELLKRVETLSRK